AGRGAAAVRVGGRHGPRRAAGDLHVRDHLLLDAAALLGALAAGQGRLRQGRHPDAAGRAGRARDGPPDPAVHRAAGGRDRAALGGGLVRQRVHGGRGRARRRVPVPDRAARARHVAADPAARGRLLAGLPGAAVRGDRYRPDPDLVGRDGLLDKKTANANIVLALKLAIFTALLFVATIVLGLLVSYA